MSEQYKVTVGMDLIDRRNPNLTATVTGKTYGLFHIEESNGRGYAFTKVDVNYQYLPAEPVKHRWNVEKPNGSFEDVGADRVAFTANHVVFYDVKDKLVVAYRAQDVVTITREEAA